MDNQIKESSMAQKGPGKAYREGISIMELADMFPNEESAIYLHIGRRPCR